MTVYLVIIIAYLWYYTGMDTNANGFKIIISNKRELIIIDYFWL